MNCLLAVIVAAEFQVQPLPPMTNAPGPLAQRALALTRREVAGMQRELKAWARDSRAKLLTDGGHTEHSIRPNTQVMIGLAVVARWGESPAEREGALADLIAMLRFVAPTHSAGPLACKGGKKWQKQWQSALWAFQAGEAAWLVWDKLDAELQQLVANMIAVEADRFVNVEPPFQIKRDTKAEENAWDAMPVALAANMFPRHPHAANWRATAMRWQLSSFLTEADAQSDRVVDGKPLRDWRLKANIHPDYTLENHDRVHPSYMACTGLNLAQEPLYWWGGQRAPESLRFNAEPIYSHLKFLTHPDGRMHFPNGQDWELHRVTVSLHAKMNVLFKDTEAAHLERISLETCERMQARTGQTLLKGEYFFPSLPGMYVADYATTFLLHLYGGEGVAPVSEEEFQRKQTGVRHFEYGQFIAQRTPAGFVSFSWGQRVMGQAIPFAKDLLGSPCEAGYVGAGVKVEKVKVELLSSGVGFQPMSPHGQQQRATGKMPVPLGNGFVVRAGLLRGDVAQEITFTSLPDGKVVYTERLTARRALTLPPLETGVIGVLNEPEWVYQPAPRHLRWQGGEWLVDGRQREPAREIVSRWINIDDRWGFAVAGADGWRYEPNTKINRGRREQRLSLLPPAKTQFAKDELIAEHTIVTSLNVSAGDTAGLQTSR